MVGVLLLPRPFLPSPMVAHVSDIGFTATSFLYVCLNMTVLISHNSDTVMCLIIRTIQLFEHPPFPGKIVYAKHSSIHIWNYSNIWTISAELQRGLLNVFYHTTGIFECLIDSYSRFQISTKLLLSLQSSNRGYKTCTSLWQSLQSSNKGCQMCTTQELENIYKPSTVFAELERGLPNVYYYPLIVYGQA